jgi:hypothetical protein
VDRYECFEGISCFSLQGRRVCREGKLIRLQGGIGGTTAGWLRQRTEMLVVRSMVDEGNKENEIWITTYKSTAGNIWMGHTFWDVPPCRMFKQLLTCSASHSRSLEYSWTLKYWRHISHISNLWPIPVAARSKARIYAPLTCWNSEFESRREHGVLCYAGSGLCDGRIPSPEEFYRVWVCVCVCH